MKIDVDSLLDIKSDLGKYYSVSPFSFNSNTYREVIVLYEKMKKEEAKRKQSQSGTTELTPENMSKLFV